MSEVNLSRWLATGVGAMAAIVLSFPIYLVKERITGGQPISAVSTATFVGRDQCISCHETAYQSWLGSDHDLAMDVADETTVRGDFNDSEFTRAGITSRFYRRDGKYFVFTDGPSGEMGELEITHTFGWEPLQQYLIPFSGGRMQALSIAWDTEREEWF